MIGNEHYSQLRSSTEENNDSKSKQRRTQRNILEYEHVKYLKKSLDYIKLHYMNEQIFYFCVWFKHEPSLMEIFRHNNPKPNKLFQHYCIQRRLYLLCT